MTANTPREPTLVAPVVAGWYCVFLTAVYKSTTTPILESRWSYVVVLTSGIGLFMVCVWMALYAEMTLRRFLIALLLVSGIGITGGLLHHAALPDDCRPTMPINAPALIGVVTVLFGVIPFCAMRRFWNWQILGPNQVAENPSRHFSLWGGMIGIAFIAATLASFQAFFPGDGLSLLSVLVFIPIPVISVIMLLALASRFNASVLLLCALLMTSLSAASELLLFKLVTQEVVTPRVFLRDYVTTWIWCASATTAWAVTITYLKMRGVVFLCGVSHKMSNTKTDRRV